MATISTITKKYGVNGLYNYLKLKSGNTESLWLAGYKSPIRLRKVKADILLFKQIFVTEEYKFDCPVNPEYIIDAGANIGLSAVYFSKTFPAAKIIAVEAEKGNFDLLLENTKGYKAIEAIHAGVWPVTAKLEIVDTGRGPTGFMVKEAGEDAVSTFDAISINDIISRFEFPYIDILKIDIEGAEKELLLQNSEWITRTRIVIIELHDNKKEGCSKVFFETFARQDFECHPFGQNFLLFNKSFRK